MDRSFLSDSNVIEASRDFVCIRLATYEDKAEAKFLENIYVGRSGKLENTVFAMLASDGKTLLSRAGRTPHQLYRTGTSMAKAMNKIAKKHTGQKTADDQVRLPQMKNFRLSLNVASCDGLSLVVAFGSDKETPDLKKTLMELAFSDQLAGKYHYFVTEDKNDLKAFKDFKGESGIYVLTPGIYGNDGKVSDAFKSKDDLKLVKDVLIGYASILNKVEKGHHSHVQQGVRDGVSWETEVPVTDPDSLRAKKGMRGGK